MSGYYPEGFVGFYGFHTWYKGSTRAETLWSRDPEMVKYHVKKLRRRKTVVACIPFVRISDGSIKRLKY